MAALLDQLEDQHGHWTVAKNDQGQPVIARKDLKTGQTWITCICTCGKIKDVRLDRLIRKNSTSCGCRRGENLKGSRWPTRQLRNDPVIQPGSIHGDWTALTEPYTTPEQHNLVVDVQCVCGTTKTIRKNSITSGDSTSCGCYKNRAAKHIIRT